MIKSKEECCTEGFYDPKGRLMLVGNEFPLTKKELVFAYVPEQDKRVFRVKCGDFNLRYCAIINDVEELKKYSIYCPKLSERKVVGEFVGEGALAYEYANIGVDNPYFEWYEDRDGFDFYKGCAENKTEITFEEFCDKFNVEPPKEELMNPEQVYYAFRSGKVEFRCVGDDNPITITSYDEDKVLVNGHWVGNKALEMSTDQGKTWTKPIVGGE